MNHLRFMSERIMANGYISGVFSFPGFIFEGITVDWMHTVDLGCAQVTCGNILWELFKSMGGTIAAPEDALSKLVSYLADAANQIGKVLPFSKLTVSMIRPDDLKPRLKEKVR